MFLPWSYGHLLGGLTPAKLRRNHSSVRRNELISDVFYLRGLIEKWGRGTNKIIDLCKQSGLPEPKFLEQTGEFCVVFKPAFKTKTVESVSSGLSPRQEQILTVIRKQRTCSRKDILEALGEKVTARTLQRDLEDLLKLGVIKTEGGGHVTRYRLKKGNS